MSTPHSASLPGENVFFGVRFFCLRHSFANVLFAPVSTPVDSPSVSAVSLWIFLSTPIIWIFCLKFGSSLRGSVPASLFVTRSRPLASRLFGCCDENSVPVLDCLLCFALVFVSLGHLLFRFLFSQSTAMIFVSLGLLPYLVLVFVFLKLLLWPSFCLGLQC